jgi:erythromycin esterase
MRSRPTASSVLLAGLLAFLSTAALADSASPADVRPAFLSWASKALHPVNDAALDASTQDLRPIEKMIGDARIVGLSEGVHAAAEPLAFRNRLFKHLVERLGFSAIALESGIVESRVLNDYVVLGKGDLDDVLTRGFSVGHGTFRQNAELLRWMKDHNARLPPRAAKVQIFGLDVPGSPGNLDAARGPDTALRFALDYLQRVDADAAAPLQARLGPYLPVLKGTNAYGPLPEAERDRLTAAIADLVSLLERKRLAYVARSTPDDFEWAERAAVGARQTDTWFRRMPAGWKFEDGFAWTRYANQVRDRAMADNLEWIRGRLAPDARVMVFAAVGHLSAAVVQMPEHTYREMIAFGTYVKQRHGRDFIGILNLLVNGEIKYCSANPQRVMPLAAPPVSAVENIFAAVKVPRYMLDLRGAPSDVSNWLQQTHDHWNGFFAQRFATAEAFDLVYFVSPVTSACIPLTDKSP